MITIVSAIAFSLTPECEKVTEKAIKIHWDYVNGKVSLREDKNWEIKQKSICERKKNGRNNTNKCTTNTNKS
jgi:hypothetical protein